VIKRRSDELEKIDQQYDKLFKKLEAHKEQAKQQCIVTEGDGFEGTTGEACCCTRRSGEHKRIECFLGNELWTGCALYKGKETEGDG